jgi:hypothetical protein
MARHPGALLVQLPMQPASWNPAHRFHQFGPVVVPMDPFPDEMVDDLALRARCALAQIPVANLEAHPPQAVLVARMALLASHQRAPVRELILAGREQPGEAAYQVSAESKAMLVQQA